MVRFTGFDGLRGLLAWLVVLHHLVLYTGLSQRMPWLKVIHPLGDGAVSLFIALSGFVVTNLVIGKAEPYWLYIRRRFLRIYPIYVVALLLGIGATWLNFQTFLHQDQAAFLYPDLARLARNEADHFGSGFVAHLAVHLTMLHGAISSNVLPESQYAFLAPAWSLSLEWQFYLVAPAIVWAARRRWPSVLLALVTVAAFHLYLRGRLGAFILPSILPGAGLLFALGIGTRLALERPGHRGSWLAGLILAAGYVYDRQSAWPVIIWGAFCYGALLSPEAVRKPLLAIFDSRIANHLGAPSYSTYLLHMPVLQALMFASAGLPWVAANATVAIVTVAVTYIASVVAYRWIELPGIRAGKRLASGAPPRLGSGAAVS